MTLLRDPLRGIWRILSLRLGRAGPFGIIPRIPAIFQKGAFAVIRRVRWPLRGPFKPHPLFRQAATLFL
jgi:hypothetical protein